MPESELLTRDQCRVIFERVLDAAKAAGADEVELTLDATASALTRFANNAIHQNVSEQHRFASIRTVVDHRTARATTNRLDDESIRAAAKGCPASSQAALLRAVRSIHRALRARERPAEVPLRRPIAPGLQRR